MSSLQSGRLEVVVVVVDEGSGVVVDNVVELDGVVVVTELEGVVVVIELDGLVVVDEFSAAEPLNEVLALVSALPLSELPEVLLEPFVPVALVTLLEPFVPVELVTLLEPFVPVELVAALFLFRSLVLLEAVSARTGVAARAPTMAAARILRVKCTDFMFFLL